MKFKKTILFFFLAVETVFALSIHKFAIGEPIDAKLMNDNFNKLNTLAMDNAFSDDNSNSLTYFLSGGLIDASHLNDNFLLFTNIIPKSLPGMSTFTSGGVISSQEINNNFNLTHGALVKAANHHYLTRDDLSINHLNDEKNYSIDFGGIASGSSEKILVLMNKGSDLWDISDLNLTSTAYSIEENSCGLSVAINERCSLKLKLNMDNFPDILGEKVINGTFDNGVENWYNSGHPPIYWDAGGGNGRCKAYSDYYNSPYKKGTGCYQPGHNFYKDAEYTFSFLLRNDSGSDTDAHLYIQSLGSYIVHKTQLSPGNYSYNFQLNEDSSGYFSIGTGNNENGIAYVDDVSIIVKSIKSSLIVGGKTFLLLNSVPSKR